MLKPKTYNLLVRCIEDGVRLGVARAHKHTDSPTQEQLYDALENAIISEILEWFDVMDNEPLQDDESVV